MNQDHRDVDRLLKANVEDQLAGLDWDRFARRAAGRLATADLQSRSGRPAVRSLAVAAAVLLIVGVVAVVVSNLKAPGSDTSPGPGRATVVFAGDAAEKRVGRCEVRIHSSAKPAPDEAAGRPSLCIVTKHESPPADAGYDNYLASLACLF